VADGILGREQLWVALRFDVCVDESGHRLYQRRGLRSAEIAAQFLPIPNLRLPALGILFYAGRTSPRPARRRRYLKYASLDCQISFSVRAAGELRPAGAGGGGGTGTCLLCPQGGASLLWLWPGPGRRRHGFFTALASRCQLLQPRMLPCGDDGTLGPPAATNGKPLPGRDQPRSGISEKPSGQGKFRAAIDPRSSVLLPRLKLD
jgi:hypothetical protein